MNNLMNDGQPVGISQSTSVTSLDHLLGALARQTQAMLDLAESNRQLAESNREMVDYLAEQQADGEDVQAPRRDLAGRPI
ncbi:hypothetical protein [Pseudomonas oryzihabitans]|uniref:Motility protein n=1 Tax=Pseudomonas oryzihabitans TaxID=47885 RepID=A0ABX3IUD1_9PSED|nr:hypothetical protein [Pseudomonas psychrotolerans]ONN70669.1 hypothetical protein BVL52_20765 [Pseudomonas psychrotolerans]